MSKIKIPGKLIEELSGFEEVVDEFLTHEQIYGNENREKKNSNFELTDFLELELKRLDKIDIFLTKKIEQQKRFSQSEKILNLQAARRNLIISKLISLLQNDQNHLKKNLANIFNAHFS